MPIDSSIYNKISDVKPSDLGGSIAQGLQMSQLVQKRDDENAKRQVFKDAMVTDDKGNQTLDNAKLLSGFMARGLPEQYVQAKQMINQDLMQKQQQQEALQKTQINEARYTVQTADPKKVYDQPSYDQWLQNGIKDGHGDAVSKMPKEFNPAFVKQIYDHASSIVPKEEILKQQLTESEIAKNKSTVNKNNYDVTTGRTDKQAAKLNEFFLKGWAGRSGEAGKVQAKLNNAEYAQGLIDQGKTQDGGLDSRQIEELAQSTARMLGGGNSASARVEALVPHTAWGKVQTLKEYLSNDPKGADAQAFVDRMADTVKRESEIALKQKRQFQIQGLGAHQDLKRRDPEAYKAELLRAGLDPSMIDEKGQYKDHSKKDSYDWEHK